MFYCYICLLFRVAVFSIFVDIQFSNQKKNNMKIFGYEISKVKKVKKVIFDTRNYGPRIVVQLVGNGWEFSDHVEFLPLITSHLNDLTDTSQLPSLSLEQRVHIFKIFYNDFCEFEIIK